MSEPEVAFQLRCIGRFAHQVEFINNGLFVLSHNFQRPQALAVFPVCVGQAGDHAQYIEIAFNLVLHAGPQQFDDDFLTALQLRRMHLGDGCGCERLGVEALEYLLDRFAIGVVENRDGLLGRERRHPVLQLGEFIRNVGWQEVTSG